MCHRDRTLEGTIAIFLWRQIFAVKISVISLAANINQCDDEESFYKLQLSEVIHHGSLNVAGNRVDLN